MNIDEILAKHSTNYKLALKNEREEYATLSSKEVKTAIKEIIEEILRMAYENAEAHLESEPYGDYEPYPVIDKQSILDVIKQIEI